MTDQTEVEYLWWGNNKEPETSEQMHISYNAFLLSKGLKSTTKPFQRYNKLVYRCTKHNKNEPLCK